MSKHDEIVLEKVSRWQVFYKNIQQDLKLFLFVLMVFCLFRVGFISFLRQYINEASSMKDILSALYYGLRISLKSAGVITLLSFLFCTLLSVFLPHKVLANIRLGLGYAYICILSLLFSARIPFYREFHAVFNQFIFNTFKDDTTALFQTLVQQYNLYGRLLFAAAITIMLCKALSAVLHTKIIKLTEFPKWYGKLAVRVGVALIIAIFMIFVRFGGSLTYANSIHWENSAISRDNFLNEAILDDVQAMYRAYVMHARLQEAQGLNVQADRIGEYSVCLSGHAVKSKDIDNFMKKTAQGAKIKKPKHIFLIIGESYAAWPLQPKYKDLNMANGLKSIIEQDNAVFVPAFLPNGTGTMEAVNGIVTGLAEVNLFPNYQPDAYREPYNTALAVQMKKLGYKTYFWYGGFSSWQRIKEFTLAQGFDEFYACSDLNGQSGNAWGSEDKYFLEAIRDTFKDDQPSFHVILTTSNHPPYTVDIKKAGFDEYIVTGNFKDKVKNDEDALVNVGNFWYSDKAITEFVQEMYKQYPESLFVMTGDHANRFNIEPNPTLYDRYAIPFVLYGQGIYKQLLPQDAVGGHLNIMPTIIELIAPEGFEYYSLCESMTRANNLGINRDFWITSDLIGKAGTNNIERLPWIIANDKQVDSEQIKQKMDAVQAVSWWRIKKGKVIE